MQLDLCDRQGDVQRRFALFLLFFYIKNFFVCLFGWFCCVCVCVCVCVSGKYSNGFCHWPQPAWMSTEEGKGWTPSQTNFTSLASPSAIGSGLTALVTLMHEGAPTLQLLQPCQKMKSFDDGWHFIVSVIHH